MNFLKNDSAQTGAILFIIVGLFIMGIYFIMVGAIMNQNQITNNNLINSSLPYSQERADTMIGIYDYFKWWPLYIFSLFIVYGIKTAIDKQSGEI